LAFGQGAAGFIQYRPLFQATRYMLGDPFATQAALQGLLIFAQELALGS
jgi:hypothetical protein